METPQPAIPGIEAPPLARWLPSALLDLSPSEPVVALRTPHRVCLQSLPSERATLDALLSRPFEITIETENEAVPLRHAPVHEVHEARLAPDLPLDWPLYYWIADGLQEDLFELGHDPAAALACGRARLAVAEDVLRSTRRSSACDPIRLDAAWKMHGAPTHPNVGKHGEPAQALQQYVRGLTGHLQSHAASRPFAERVRELLQFAERRPEIGLPSLTAAEARLLGLYAQHRLFGGAWLTAPAGMIAGWHLLLSVHVLAVWYSGLLVQSRRETSLRNALLESLWLLDQGLWRDETLVHDVLSNLNASEYTSPELAAALTTALRAAHVQA
jgi:hypothetical protein